jgi:hypothetical protein
MGISAGITAPDYLVRQGRSQYEPRPPPRSERLPTRLTPRYSVRNADRAPGDQALRPAGAKSAKSPALLQWFLQTFVHPRRGLPKEEICTGWFVPGLSIRSNRLQEELLKGAKRDALRPA